MPPVAIAAWIAIALALVTYVQFTGHLQRAHPGLWDKLGQPTVYNDFRNLFQPKAKFWSFLFSGAFWTMGDRRLRVLGVAFLCSNIALIALFTVHLTA